MPPEAATELFHLASDSGPATRTKEAGAGGGRKPPPLKETEAEKREPDTPKTVDFRCLACGLAALCPGSLHERLRLCFLAYDTDQTGRIDPERAAILVRSLTRIAQAEDSHETPGRETESERRASLLLSLSAGAGSSGLIGFEALFEAVQLDPCLVEAFGVAWEAEEMQTTRLYGSIPMPGVGRQGGAKGKGGVGLEKPKGEACEVCQVGTCVVS